jgi:hypothetical protein
MKRIIRRETRSARNHRRSHSEFVEHTPAPRQAATKPARRHRRFVFLLLVLCLLGSGAASFVLFRYIAPRTPQELVGTWQVIDGELMGATLEFGPYGTAVAIANKQGQMETTKSSVKVEGKKIYLSSADGTFIQTIVKLTDDELVIRDPDRRIYRMVRVRN